MEIKLTDEEKGILKDVAQREAKTKTKQIPLYDIEVPISELLDKVQEIIKDNPDLTYSDLSIVCEDGYDGYKEYFLEYCEGEAWQPIYEKKCEDALNNKKYRYKQLQRLKEEFGEDK